MPKITTLTAQNVETLRAEIALALKDIENRYGIVIKTGGCRYSNSSANLKIEIATVGSNGEVIDSEASMLRRNLINLGLLPEHLEKTIAIGGKTFKLAGYKKARYSKPFSLRCNEDGKLYVATDSQIRSALGLPRRLDGWTPIRSVA